MAPGDLDIAPERIRPLRRVEYERMVELGILGEDERVELLEGMLVTVSPESAGHAQVVTLLNRLFTLALRDRAEVRVGNPFAATDDSEPEPDVALVPPGLYWLEHPSRTFLIIEVSHSSARKDRGVKRRVYARAGVPEYWVFLLGERAVEVYTDLDGEDYRSVVRHDTSASLSPRAFPDVVVPLRDLFPPIG